MDVPAFPGYGDEDARKLSDEYVRARLGEALVPLRENAGAASSDLLEALILRCEFVNQVAFKSYEHAETTQEQIAAVSQNDEELMRLAAQAQTLSPAQIDEFLQRVKAALDARDRAMEVATG